MTRITLVMLIVALGVGPGFAQEATAKTPPEPEAPATLVAKALATAKHKNRRALVAVLGEDVLSKTVADALKKDRKLSRQLLYEFGVAVVAPGDAAALKAAGLDAEKAVAPRLVVLDAESKLLGDLDAAALAPNGEAFSAEKLSKRLEGFHCPPIDADRLLEANLAAAKEQRKALLLHFDAPW